MELVYDTHTPSWRSILIFSTYLYLGLPSYLFPSDPPTRTPHAPLFSTIHPKCFAHLILLHLITWIIFGEEFRTRRFSLHIDLQSLFILCLLGPNIFLSTLFQVTSNKMQIGLSILCQTATTYLEGLWDLLKSSFIVMWKLYLRIAENGNSPTNLNWSLLYGIPAKYVKLNMGYVVNSVQLFWKLSFILNRYIWKLV